MYYLLVKTHNRSNLKYLCKHEGTQESALKYCGSGVYWKRHLKIHGKYITTKILTVTDNIEELKMFALAYSKLWNVVESKEWANLIEETGFPLGGKYSPNYGKKWSKETNKKKGRPGHHVSSETISKISKALQNRFVTEETKEKIRQKRMLQIITKESIKKGIQTRRTNKLINMEWWLTPIGSFKYREEAAKALSMDGGVLKNYCKNLNSLPLTKMRISFNTCEYIKNARVGQTPKELGFGFKEI